MESTDQGVLSPREGEAKSHLVTFPYEARRKSYILGIRPPTQERMPTGRTLSTFSIDAAGRDKPIGSIDGFLSEEDGLKVLDVDSIENHTAFVNHPPHKPNYVHVEDRSPNNANYIPRLIPNVVKQMLEAGIIDVWYSSNIKDNPPRDPDNEDLDASLDAWFVHTISSDAKFMYDVSLPELGLNVEEVDRVTQDVTGREITIKSYKVTLPPKQEL